MRSGEQRQVCWETINDTNRLIRLTHPYAYGAVAEQLVAIHALFGCLDQVVVQSTEDHVARTKLNWWRLETRKEVIRQSRHPVLGYLDSTGVTTKLQDGMLEQLLAVTERRLDSKPPSDIDEFHQLCHQIYQPRIDLETSLSVSLQLPEDHQRSMARKGGLLLLIRDTFSCRRSLEEALWWIPLGLLARHGVNRADLARDLETSEARSVFHEICSTASSGHILQRSNESGDDEGYSAHIHLLLLEFLHGRQLERLNRAGPAWGGQALRRFYLIDVFSLWLAARKIGKDAEN